MKNNPGSKRIINFLYKKLYPGRKKKKSEDDLRRVYLPENGPAGNLGYLLYDIKRKGFKCDCILDVGAHDTQWIRMQMKLFPDATAYLIEPLSEMEQHLKDFCSDYPTSKYFLCGAGSKEGNFYLTVSGHLEGANFLQKSNKTFRESNRQRVVKIITIDSLLESGEIDMPGLVKLDIQGFELEALKGAEMLFGNTEIFILEVSFFEFIEGTPLFSEVVGFMSLKGYEIYDFPGFLRRPFDNALGQADVCFVRKDGFLRSSNAWF
ncbi:MAG: FkbM family methyltransferase [Ignavibacteria bacterium]|nr:FkbM family methyltransferase [Ignavibacteria bacterium]